MFGRGLMWQSGKVALWREQRHCVDKQRIYQCVFLRAFFAILFESLL